MFILLLSLSTWAITENIITASIILVTTLLTKRYIGRLENNALINKD